MLTLWNQRWRERRGSYRPAGETIRTCDVYVLLDRIGRERTDKRRMVALKDIELVEEAPNAL